MEDNLTYISNLYWLVIPISVILFLAYFFLKRKTRQSIVDRISYDLGEIRKGYSNKRREIVDAYNKEAEPIKRAYRSSEKNDLTRKKYQSQLEAIWPRYADLERPLKEGCRRDETEYCAEAKRKYTVKPGAFPESLWQKLLLVPFVYTGVIFLIGLIVTLFVSCGGSNTENSQEWSAANIPMPHLQDASQYVSDPDNVLSDSAVLIINKTMSRIDHELGIENAVIIVNHIAGDDPFRLTQDIFERYGIGKDDRGLVIAIGYEDHSSFIATGSNLEADLTDVMCDKLLGDYLVPYMKAEQPDKGMIVLTRAIYKYLSQQNMPRAAMVDVPEKDDPVETFFVFSGIMLLVLLGWFICICFIWELYEDRIANIRPKGILPGPWYNDTVQESEYSYRSNAYGSSYGSTRRSSRSSYSSSSSSSWSSSSSSSSSSHIGGSYSGGHSSGGGAGRRW